MQNNNSFGHYDRIIIHTPHAGTILPIKWGHSNIRWWVRFKAIYPLHKQLTDHYTDKLFAAKSPSIRQISFLYSRLFCDVERLLDDPLEKKGLGICYDVEKFINKAMHCWDGAWAVSKEIAMASYYDHHKALAQLIQGSGPYSKLLLLDCHSFSEQDNVLCPNAHEYKDIDICIGFNEDATKPSQETLDQVAIFFQNRGYRISFNKPFSNSKTVDTDKPYHSLMIEVNKHCYMNEDTLEKTDGFDKLHAELQELYKLLLNW